MADFSTWFLWMLSSINATTVNRGVIQATPGTPVWEEIEDIFRNYYIDMRIIYMVLTWLWIWQFDCYQIGIISIVLQWLRHIGRSRNTISFRFLCLCLNLWAFLFSTPPPPPPPPMFQHGALLVHINNERIWVTMNNTSGLVAQANHVLNLHCSSSHFKQRCVVRGIAL